MSVIRRIGKSMVPCLVGASTIPMVQAQVRPIRQPQNIVLVELFTSEGCSSCPPADELLHRVNGRQTAAGQLVVGISEHVTYWNRLGWTDPFSASAYTDRQERYVSRFQLDSPYTPQMVVNGQQQFVGSDEAQLNRALSDQAKQKHIDLRILSAEIHSGSISIHFSATQLLSNHPLSIVAVLAEDVANSTVLRGENVGRSLQHVAVARSLTTVATIQKDTETTVTIPLSASDGARNQSAHHLILFAQELGQGAIVGADTKPAIL